MGSILDHLDVGFMESLLKGSGSNISELFHDVKKLDERGNEYRLLIPPVEQLEGGFNKSFFFREIMYKIGTHYVTSPESFGLPCPIQKVVDLVKAKGTSLQKASLKEREHFQRMEKFHLYGCVVESYPKQGFLTVDNLEDGKLKIIRISSSPLMKDIVAIFTSRGGHKVFDAKEGKILRMYAAPKSEGQKFSSYKALALTDAEPLPDEVLADFPDAVYWVKRQIYTDKYIQQLMLQFLGEIDEVGEAEYRWRDELDAAKADGEVDMDEMENERKAEAKAPKRKPLLMEDEDESGDDDYEEEVLVTKAPVRRATPPVRATKSSLLDEDEATEPKAPKRAGTVKRSNLLDNVEDEDTGALPRL